MKSISALFGESQECARNLIDELLFNLDVAGGFEL